MSKEPLAGKARTIHVRLDGEMHRRLKIHATRHGITIQQTIEGLVRQSLFTSARKNIKS